MRGPWNAVSGIKRLSGNPLPYLNLDLDSMFLQVNVGYSHAEEV